MTAREERLAFNQTLFRNANERIAAWPERQEADPAQPASYFCECSRTDCREQITLTPKEYEAARADARRFVIAPGHDLPEVERVTDEHEPFAVVEKYEDTAPVVEATDPRRN